MFLKYQTHCGQASRGVTEMRRLKQLEDENAKLKRLVADLTLDKAMLQDVLRKNGEARRLARDRAPSAVGLRYRRATGRKATGFHRTSQRYTSRGDTQTELRMRLKDLAAS